MATTSYQHALEAAEALPYEERLNLIKELTAKTNEPARPKRSVLEFAGLGKEIWQEIDTDEYLRQERASWDR